MERNDPDIARACSMLTAIMEGCHTPMVPQISADIPALESLAKEKGYRSAERISRLARL